MIIDMIRYGREEVKAVGPRSVGGRSVKARLE